MPTAEHDAYLKLITGVDVAAVRIAARSGAQPGARTRIVIETDGDVTIEGPAHEEAHSTAPAKQNGNGHSAAAPKPPQKQATTAPATATVPRPFEDDCTIVMGKVPGPKAHVPCGVHKHVLDMDSKQIIANSLDEYKSKYPQPHHGNGADGGHHGHGAGAHPEPGGNQAVPRPMEDGCTIVIGKVPGPKAHVLCGAHKHVLDMDAKQIIANSLDEYKTRFPQPKHAHGGGHHDHGQDGAPAPSNPASGAHAPGPPHAGAAALQPTSSGPAANLQSIPVPKVPSEWGQRVVDDMSTLDMLKPVQNDPANYSAVVNGTQMTVPKDKADELIKKAKDKLTKLAGSGEMLAKEALTGYQEHKDSAVSTVVDAANRLATWGKFKDPGDDIKRLASQAQAQGAQAKAALSSNQFGAYASGKLGAQHGRTQLGDLIPALAGAIMGPYAGVIGTKAENAVAQSILGALNAALQDRLAAAASVAPQEAKDPAAAMAAIGRTAARSAKLQGDIYARMVATFDSRLGHA